MSNDKKVSVFFEKLDKNKLFQIKIRNIRAGFGIEIDGYNSLKDGFGWLLKKESWDEDMFKKNDVDYQKLQSFNKAKQNLIGDFKIPLSFVEFLESKIVFSDKVLKKYFLPNNFGCLLIESRFQDQEFNPEEYWKKSGEPYVKLLIHKGASRDSVKEYISKNWKKIEKIIGKEVRIRKRPMSERDGLIFDFSKKSNEALGIKQYEKSRDIVIARLMKENGFSEVTAEIVRKVVSLQKKLQSL
ncbi:MAG TPA: hypothetical protein VJH67_00110 [Candidatus Paceibacterota bacterium]